jgi:predicted nucleic acid-binding protein
MEPSRPIVVYDANVLYPAQLRDFLMWVAVNKLVDAHWTEAIQHEWMRNLLADRDDLTEEQLGHTREQMERALPNACVDGHTDWIEDLTLPDPSDRHVLAAAIHVNADALVTINLKDFPEEQLSAFGITSIHPDQLVCTLFDRCPDEVIATAADHRSTLTNPEKSPDEYILDLQNGELRETATLLEEHTNRL